jgi:hypothetical protein
MRGIDAHDEFAFWVTRQVQLDLAALSRRRRLEPGMAAFLTESGDFDITSLP